MTEINDCPITFPRLFPGTQTRAIGQAFAPSNIALCKYWGKKHTLLNTPTAPSLSISLGSEGTTVTVTSSETTTLHLNGVAQHKASVCFQRTDHFLKLLTKQNLAVCSQNTLPTGAGFATSASYFAALTLACNDFFGWNASLSQLSQLARLGSGSACRSLWQGFVTWLPHDDPAQSHGRPLLYKWENLRLGLLLIDPSEKNLPSRDGMALTQKTSVFYPAWIQKSWEHYKALEQSILSKDFQRFGEITESNSLALTALLLSADPPILYSQPTTWQIFQTLRTLRGLGLQVYATQDAGPNLVLLFQQCDQDQILKTFPYLKIIAPFPKEGIA